MMSSRNLLRFYCLKTHYYLWHGKLQIFTLFLPLCVALISFLPKLSEALRSAIFLFLILVRTPSSSPNRYALYFLSRSLLHSLSLTQITPITAHSSSPAPLSLPLHTSLQQTHTHTHTHSLSMQLFKKGIYLSASVWSWDCRRPPFIKRTAICYTAYVCVSREEKQQRNTERVNITKPVKNRSDSHLTTNYIYKKKKIWNYIII